MKRPGPYAPLAAHYADDEKIITAGEASELMYVRMLAYAARTPRTDGLITKPVVLTRLGFTDPEKRLEKLLETGLVSEEPQGYRIVSWLRWNRSGEQIDRERAQDRNRKSSENTGNGPGKPPGKGTGVQADIRGADTDTDTEGESARADVLSLCEQLADRIEKNGSKRPTIGKTWIRSARLLLDADERDHAEASRLIDWCQDHSFWQANVLSMSKFREKYDTMRLQSQQASRFAPRITNRGQMPEGW